MPSGLLGLDGAAVVNSVPEPINIATPRKAAVLVSTVRVARECIALHALPGGETVASRCSSPSTSDSFGSAQGAPGRPKSAKRRAAEALLAARYGVAVDRSAGASTRAAAGAASAAARPRAPVSVAVPPAQQQTGLAGVKRSLPPSLSSCTKLLERPVHKRRKSSAAGTPPQQQGASTAAADDAGGAAASGDGTQGQAGAQAAGGSSRAIAACPTSCSHPTAHGWCHHAAQLPHVDWQAVIGVDTQQLVGERLAPGYERWRLPGGVQALLVENPVHLPDALAKLRASMPDPYVAIDLEWRPEFGRRFTPVAMLQLASPRLALLVRTCRMHYRLPESLKAFMADPNVCLVGFHWDGADDSKMQVTFGAGAERLFARLLDLRQVAAGLGYHGHGLQRLTQHVLGLQLSKSRTVTMSNWETQSLSKGQVKYAALDVLVAGQVLRGLRLWHSSPSPCASCLQPLGAVLLPALGTAQAAAGTRDGAAAGAAAAAAPGSQQQQQLEQQHQPPLQARPFACTAHGCHKSFSDPRAYLQHCQLTGHAAAWAWCDTCGRVHPVGAVTGGAAAAGHDH